MEQKHIVFLSWKCIKHPKAGGSEVVHQEISKRLVRDGYKVTHLVPGHKSLSKQEMVEGVNVIRVGNSVKSFLKLPFYFHSKLRKNTDVLIDAFNCFGSFASIGFKQSCGLIHHVQGIIWHHQFGTWYHYPLQLAGRVLEAVQLKILGFFNVPFITVSESTEDEIEAHGVSEVHRITEGSDIHPVRSIAKKNNEKFTVLFIGRLVKMKRPMDALKSFKMFHEKFPNSQMWICGDGEMQPALEKAIKKWGLTDAVDLAGRVSHEKKITLMQIADVLIVTSVKEGWGLVVTEANSQGTPAITYNVAGLRDSNKGGLLTIQNNPKFLADTLVKVASDKNLHYSLRRNSWQHSLQYTFEHCYDDFVNVIKTKQWV